LDNPRLAPEGTPLWHSRVGEFAPRISGAYHVSTRPGREATLRVGAGQFYDLGLGSIANAYQFVYPFYATSATANVAIPIPAANRVPPVLGTGPPSQLFLLDPNLRLPYTTQWSGVWEQRVGNASVLSAAYVGAAGRRLLVLQNYFQPLAQWPSVPVS